MIEALLEKFPPLVATLEDVPDEVVGWACREFERPVLHMVYVKQPYRRQGVARVLIHGVTEYSHRTPAGEAILKKVGALYNPYAVLEALTCRPKN